MIRDIVAVDAQGGMAKGGKTPWFIPEDLAYFHEQTKRFGGNLLVGRGTYEAMMKGMTERGGEAAWPPAGRNVYVLTSHDLPDTPGVTIIRSLENFLNDMQKAGQDIWNGSIHDDVEPDEIYLTRIHATYECDKFYPVERLSRYRLIRSWPGTLAGSEPHYTFEVYARLQP